MEKVKIAPEEQFLPLSTIFYYLMLDFCVKTGIRFSLRDKRLFEITEVEITRVDCIVCSKGQWYSLTAFQKYTYLTQIFSKARQVRDRAWFVRLYGEIIPEL